MICQKTLQMLETVEIISESTILFFRKYEISAARASLTDKLSG